VILLVPGETAAYAVSFKPTPASCTNPPFRYEYADIRRKPKSPPPSLSSPEGLQARVKPVAETIQNPPFPPKLKTPMNAGAAN
jgi:hypothetical protein